MQQSCIYAIANSINGSCYVGSAVDFKTRKARHLNELRQGKHHSPHLQRAYDKYGETAFIFYIIEDVKKDRQLLFERESYWIFLLRPAYNVGHIDYTHLGVKRSKVTIQRMSEAAFTRPKRTKESIQKTRLANLGRKQSEKERQKRSEVQRKRHVENPMSEETKRKNSESNKGIKRSEEARKNISKAHIGVRRSEESRHKQSETLKGTVFSEERRRNISEAKKAGWARKKALQAEQAKLTQQNTQLSLDFDTFS